MADWFVHYCAHTGEGQSGGQVKVTTLTWEASLTDGPDTVFQKGSTGDHSNRVYALPALQAVPESVMVGWAKQAIDDEAAATGSSTVAEIEAQLDDLMVTAKDPAEGGLVPA